MAGSYFRESREVQNSTIKYLKDEIDGSWSNVSTVLTFSQALSKNTPLPVVCIRIIDQYTDRLELGSNTLNNTYGIVIDIFAKSDAQKLDLADFILDKLKDGWVYYQYSHVSGDKTQVDTVADGRISVTEFNQNSSLDFGEQVDFRDRYRQVISIVVKKSI